MKPLSEQDRIRLAGSVADKCHHKSGLQRRMVIYEAIERAYQAGYSQGYEEQMQARLLDAKAIAGCTCAKGG